MLQDLKRKVQALWKGLDRSDEDSWRQTLSDSAWPTLHWHGHDPVNDLLGPESVLSQFWTPLRHSFPDLQRHIHLFVSGLSNGRVDGNLALDNKPWVSATGLFEATFAKPYLGIPAHQQPVKIRWGEFLRFESGRIAEIYFLIDLIDLLEQVGLPVLSPSLGVSGIYPGPLKQDGLLFQAQDPLVSAESLRHIRQFIFDGLNQYDQSDLTSMGMANYFNKFTHWFGPGGIGYCHGLEQFENFHQKHWLIAFPDRRVQDLNALIAEGSYSGGPGWAGVRATHAGGYLGTPATHRTIVVNGMDWWRREGHMFTENWVFVDMVHLFRQFGVNLLERIPQGRGL